jgi:hypothetical protein
MAKQRQQTSTTPPTPTDYQVIDDLHIVHFDSGVILEIRHPHYDRQRRLLGEIVAKLDDVVVNQGQLNFLDQRQRIDFHAIALSRDGRVDWQSHLLSAIQPLENELARQEQTEETAKGSAVIEPMGEAVLPFPVDVFPRPLAELIQEGAKALPCPPDFIAVPMLSVLGTAIGTSRAIEIKIGWVEGPRIYDAVVADPGSKKSPALALAMAPLNAQQEEYRKQFTEDEKDYEAELGVYEIQEAEWREALKKKQAKSQNRPQRPKEPVMPQIWTSDTTLEGLAELIDRNPRGVLFAEMS